jgi:hypothetical protein
MTTKNQDYCRLVLVIVDRESGVTVRFSSLLFLRQRFKESKRAREGQGQGQRKVTVDEARRDCHNYFEGGGSGRSLCV